MDDSMCIMWLLSRFIKFKTSTVMIRGKKFSAYIADTPARQAIGLMFRERLKNSECMLFIFNKPGSYGIWMRNMRFPIDIIWLDDCRKVISVKNAVQPAGSLEFTTYHPSAAAKYVIEIQSGFIRQNKIKVGQHIDIPI